jgi:GntR family transcriptional regulator / MocR family aminotransferase
MEPLFEIGVERSARGSRQSSQSLYRQLKEAIADGRLAAGTKLPATRRSASYFGVSRNTAIAVYEKLLSEGYVVARNGSGTYVAQRPNTPAAARTRARAQSPAVRSPASSPCPQSPRLNDFWLRPEVTAAMSFWRDAPETAPSRREGAGVDFRPALVDPRLFPLDVFRRVSAKRLRGLERKPASYKSPQGNQGNYHLREAITRHIAVTRAVVCQSEDVLVTSGAQQAFDLLARTLVRPNVTVVAVEDPGYPPMRVAFAAAGAKLVPVAVDNEGLIVDQLPRNAGVICVCPSHQFPVGVTMSVQRRKALVDFARGTGAVIVEDDYDGEFRYAGNPLQALRATDSADVVFYVGTFSKCMLPSLRLGFIVAPDWAMQTLIAAKNCLDWHCPTPVQIGVAGFIADGHLTHHVRKMRKIYKQRRDLLLGSIEVELKDWLVPVSSLYGMHVAALARAPLDLERLTESLLEHNVKIHSLRRYFLGPPTHTGLVLGFGATGLQGIARGIMLLRKALRG